METLQAILRHHVTTSVYLVPELTDGPVLGMADGTLATISTQAKIVASIRGSNGIVHVIDGVVAPK